MKLKLLSYNRDAKTRKSNTNNTYQTAILYLDNTYNHNRLCPASSEGCRSSCLLTAGWGTFNWVQKGRRRKTKLYFNHYNEFMQQLYWDIHTFSNYCIERGYQPCIRLNGTSDIVWEVKQPTIFSDFPNVIFYDYTKLVGRFLRLPKNYYLTYSYSEKQGFKQAQMVLEKGYNVAIVFRDKLPKTYWGYTVISGEENDMRFLDPRPAIVGLKAKGKARYDKTGFVVDL